MLVAKGRIAAVIVLVRTVSNSERLKRKGLDLDTCRWGMGGCASLPLGDCRGTGATCGPCAGGAAKHKHTLNF